MSRELVYADSVVDLMGDTPLVRLNRVTEGIDGRWCWPRSSTSTPAGR